MTQPLRADEGWIDTPDYPHRIENHVKVYLHLEPAPQPVVRASPDTALAGTRVYQRRPDGEADHGTVTGWTSDGSAVFVSYDHGGTYAGPTFGSVYLEPDTATAGQWAVSGVTVDGYPLDGTENGNYCDYEGHPIGARPDWDRQQQAAEALGLPTADELLPLLADALGSSIDGPTSDQLRSAAELLSEHAAWRSERADLSAGESAGDIPAASDWQASDDTGCDLADRAIALLAEITGRQIPVGEEAAAAEVPTMHVPRGGGCRRKSAASPPRAAEHGIGPSPGRAWPISTTDTREKENQMNETSQTPTGRADIAWGRITRHSESGSFIEDRLAGLVDTTPPGSRFQVDVVYPDQVPAE